MLCNELFNFMHISLIYFNYVHKERGKCLNMRFITSVIIVVYLLVVCATVNIYINQKYMNGYLV